MTGFPQKESPVDDFTVFVLGIAGGAALVLGIGYAALRRWGRKMWEDS